MLWMNVLYSLWKKNSKQYFLNVSQDDTPAAKKLSHKTHHLMIFRSHTDPNLKNLIFWVIVHPPPFLLRSGSLTLPAAARRPALIMGALIEPLQIRIHTSSVVSRHTITIFLLNKVQRYYIKLKN